MSFDVTVTGAALAHAAHWAAALAPRNPPDPALRGVLLVADTFEGGTLTLSGSDENTTGTINAADPEVTDGGRRLVSGRLLADIAARIGKEPRIRLCDSAGADRLDVSTGDGSWWSLPLLRAEDYPALPRPAGAVATVAAGPFARILDRVSLAVSDPKFPPLFGGISLGTEPGVGLVVATTDRYRLAVAEIEHTSVRPDETGVPLVLVPAPVLRATVTAIDTADDEQLVTIHTDRVTFSLSGPNHQVTGRLIGAEHANGWRRVDRHIVTTAAAATFDIATAALRTALDRATVALDPDEAVEISVDHDGMTITPSKGEKAHAALRVAHLSFGGAPVRFGCKPEYLRDLLTGLAADTVRLRYLDGRNPMIGGVALDAAGQVVPGFRMAQSPVNLDAARRVAA